MANACAIIYRARAQDADITAIVALCAEHAQFEQADYHCVGKAETLRSLLSAAPPRLHIWLAEVDSVAVGYASATIDFSTWQLMEFVHMDCLYVRPEWRAQGIGEQLFNTVECFARTHNIGQLQWQSPSWNTKAQRFYSARGATSVLKCRYALSVKL